MIEKHPIDDLFKGLAEAEVVPPAAVWEGIIAHQSWSDRLLASTRKYWWVPLLFLLFTGAGIGAAINNNTGMASMSSASLLSALPQEVPTDKTFRAVSNTSVIDQSAQEHNSELAFNKPDHTTSPDRSGDDSNPSTPSDKNSSVNTSRSFSTPHNGVNESGEGDQRQESIEPSTSSETSHLATVKTFGEEAIRFTGRTQSIEGFRTVALNDEDAYFMDIRETAFMTDPPQKSGTKKGKPYTTVGSIPPADWWVGGSVGYYNTSLNYEGTSSELRAALNAGETGTHSVVIEGLVGRVWRNGFFVSAGLGTESISSRAGYSEVLSHGIYADSLLSIYNPADSTTSLVLSSVLIGAFDSTHNYSATNRYNLIRIPLSVGWQKDIGRVELGVQGGVVFEFGAGRKGYSLTNGQNPDDISLVSAQRHVIGLEESALNPRYGVGISGTAGLHLGYKVNEFFSIWASPEYSTRLTTISKDPLQMKASRTGVRLGIRYILPY